MREVLAENSDANDVEHRLIIIPNWADGRAVFPHPKDTNRILVELNAQGRFVIQYSGNIGRFHEISTILGAAKRLQGEHDFLFLFIGVGKQATEVRAAATRGAAGNVVLLPFQPREMLGTTLTACDVGLVTLKAGLRGLAVPSKLYGILAAGRPVVVVGPEDCEAAAVVREKACGVVVPPGDVEGLVNALRMLKDDPARVARLGVAARMAFEEKYDIEQVSDVWAEMLCRIA
jgi:glycosyltransferase involved in cell wall biosynthesis